MCSSKLLIDEMNIDINGNCVNDQNIRFYKYKNLLLYLHFSPTRPGSVSSLFYLSLSPNVFLSILHASIVSQGTTFSLVYLEFPLLLFYPSSNSGHHYFNTPKLSLSIVFPAPFVIPKLPNSIRPSHITHQL